MRCLVAAVVTGLLVSGCTPQAPVSPMPAPTTDLAVAREAAGLPDCVDTDPAAPAVDRGLPATRLGCLGSAKVVNLAGLPRRPMVVNLWAQWCRPCRQESPYLREAFNHLGDRVAFVGINYLDPQPGLAIEFAGLVGWRFQHLADPERTLQSSLGVPGVPLTLFVDDHGRIVGRHPGPVTSTAELRSLISAYLGIS